MNPFPFDSAYSSTISIAPPNLGNTLTQFAIEPSPTIRSKMYSPQNYVALTDNVINIYKLDIGAISNIQEYADGLSSQVEPFDNINLEMAQNLGIVEPEYVTKFYIGSITVIGLYIFYRILVKNR